jgi:hypothetical protein
MTISAMKKIIEHQVNLSLQDRSLTKSDIGTKQYQQELYEMAIKMLVEL